MSLISLRLTPYPGMTGQPMTVLYNKSLPTSAGNGLALGRQAVLQARETLVCDLQISALSLQKFFLCFRCETVRKRFPRE